MDYSDVRIVRKTFAGGAVRYYTQVLTDEWVYYPERMGSSFFIPNEQAAREAKQKLLNNIAVSEEILD